jgi:mannose-6-phosphate isomerase-like protein (cupin superfamily)
MSERVGSIGLALAKGITPAGTGKVGPSQDVVWNILGHTYWLKAESDGCFIFETLDPPGTFVPPHIHPTQDEFIYMLEGTFDLYLDGAWTKASAGDLVRMPRGLPHGYYNKQDKPARALFSVFAGASPARIVRSASQPDRSARSRPPLEDLRGGFPAARIGARRVAGAL